MNLSPFQLLHSRLMKISVEYSSVKHKTNDENAAPSRIEEFEIEQIAQIKLRDQKVSEGSKEPSATERSYIVLLGMRTTDGTLRHIPYTFEVVVSGVISAQPIDGKSETELNDLAAQYGYSLLYGQIRETIANLTSRMRWGTFVMPTLSFMGAKYSGESEEPQPEPSKKNAEKKASRETEH